MSACIDTIVPFGAVFLGQKLSGKEAIVHMRSQSLHRRTRFLDSGMESHPLQKFTIPLESNFTQVYNSTLTGSGASLLLTDKCSKNHISTSAAG
jgi:hypothetical protein